MGEIINAIVKPKPGRKYPTAKSLANLIPVTSKSKEEARLISSKGGKGNKNNPKSIIAARLREMKKKGMSEEHARMLHDMMTSSDLASMHILSYLTKAMKSADKTTEINAIAKTTIDWYKIKHGSAESNKTLNLNIQILTPEEREKEIIRLMQ